MRIQKHKIVWSNQNAVIEKSQDNLKTQIGNAPIDRVARWFVFKPKIQIWVNYGGSCTGRCWYILWTLGPFYSLLLYFMDIWYSSWQFGISFPVLVFCAKKNLATLPIDCGDIGANFLLLVDIPFLLSLFRKLCMTSMCGGRGRLEWLWNGEQ
jgi:hypothetical protein